MAEIQALKRENEKKALEAESRNEPLVDHMPTWLNMTNTTRCNLKCIMCNQGYGKIETWTMEKEIYDYIVKYFYPFVGTVQLTAIGEPLMTPRLPSKIRDMERYGVRLEMVTNGTLLKGEGLLRALARVARLMIFSLDGATPGTFNSIRVGADFDQVVSNIRRFNEFRLMVPPERRPEIKFNYILMKRNIRELPEFISLAKELGASAVVCTHMVLFEKGLEDEMLENHPELSNRYTREAEERARKLGIGLVLPPPFPEGEEGTKGGETEDGETDAGEGRKDLPGRNLSGDGEEEYRGERCPFLWQRVYIGPRGAQ